MAVDIEKAHAVINVGFDTMLDGLRKKKRNDQDHLDMKDATAAVNSANSSIREVYAGKMLYLRIYQMLPPEQKKSYLPEIFPEIKLLEEPKKEQGKSQQRKTKKK